MSTRILCAGFGGQGALLIGKLVAEAGMKEGKYVTWLPSYGPEMRGGTANVMAVVSDKPVGSPIFTKIDALVALNQPSLEKFASQIAKNGVILANADLCEAVPSSNGVREVMVPLTKIAEQVGSVKATNMVALGALIQLTGCVDVETVKADLTEMLSAKNPQLLSQNLEALDRGADFVIKARV